MADLSGEVGVLLMCNCHSLESSELMFHEGGGPAVENCGIGP